MMPATLTVFTELTIRSPMDWQSKLTPKDALGFRLYHISIEL
jgi:hypothetical protein